MSDLHTRSGTRADNVDEARRIFAVVVTFDPDLTIFDSLLSATREQVERIVVIDNGSQRECAEQLARCCEQRAAALHLLPNNLGIAAAQNKGITLARQAGATDVLLLDHDSIPDAAMVTVLSECAKALRRSGHKVGAVGPVIVDRHAGTHAPVPQIVSGAVRFIDPAPAGPTRCEYLIASGTLIETSVLDLVGPMNDAYFVDQVDVEWCLRAGADGFEMFCVSEAHLQHAIGDDVVSFWLFGARRLPVHSPKRDYFYFRNTVRLIREKFTAPPFRRFWARRLVRLLVVQTLFAPPRLKRLHAMVTGVLSAFTEPRDSVDR
jgi:rhamnosyltransferase